jgi:prepilin-type processing-associated H-X9-DG protein
MYGSTGEDASMYNPPFNAMRRFFGYPAFDGNPEVDSKKITDMEHPSSIKALQDIDYWSNPGGWATATYPEQVLRGPAHGSPDEIHAIRNFLYYDWHVEVEMVERHVNSY